MKSYFADTNFYLRFILQDNKEQADKVEGDLKKASRGQKRIVFLSAVFLEMAFVLKSYYSLSTSEIARYLSILVKTKYLEIEDREIWLRVFSNYVTRSISLMDLFLFERAKDAGGDVLSFDKDFERLKQLS